MHVDNGEYRQGNIDDITEPSHSAERTTTDALQIVPQAVTPLGINEPVYTDIVQRPHQNCNDTLVELPNPMYATATPQQNQEPAVYQETQRELKNVLYGELL